MEAGAAVDMVLASGLVMADERMLRKLLENARVTAATAMSAVKWLYCRCRMLNVAMAIVS